MSRSVSDEQDALRREHKIADVFGPRSCNRPSYGRLNAWIESGRMDGAGRARLYVPIPVELESQPVPSISLSAPIEEGTVALSVGLMFCRASIGSDPGNGGRPILLSTGGADPPQWTKTRIDAVVCARTPSPVEATRSSTFCSDRAVQHHRDTSSVHGGESGRRRYSAFVDGMNDGGDGTIRPEKFDEGRRPDSAASVRCGSPPGRCQ